jgi:beta-glucanase (GH16 family)
MNRLFYGIALGGSLLLVSCDEKEIDTATPISEYTELVWSDDFTSTTLDETKWNKGVGFYFNETGEKQFFTNRPENVFIKDGNLIIQAKKETYQGQPYTSGDLSTKGKFNFQDNYRIDIRAKMSKGAGLWNSFAFLPEELKYGPYPKSGAITLEHLTRNPQSVILNVAYGSKTENIKKSKSILIDKDTFGDDYHTFSAVWGNNLVRWYFDEKEVLRVQQSDFDNAIYPFNERFFLTIKTAVGGSLAGEPTAETVFPQQLSIDYIKVYRLSSE